jgi:hypothetical protein
VVAAHRQVDGEAEDDPDGEPDEDPRVEGPPAGSVARRVLEVGGDFPLERVAGGSLLRDVWPPRSLGVAPLATLPTDLPG